MGPRYGSAHIKHALVSLNENKIEIVLKIKRTGIQTPSLIKIRLEYAYFSNNNPIIGHRGIMLDKKCKFLNLVPTKVVRFSRVFLPKISRVE